MIVNVPLRAIAGTLHASVAHATLLVIAFNLTFAALMPLTAWAGGWFGRRRVFTLATVLLACAALATFIAPSIDVLITLRIVQGAATAAITPVVMSLLAEMFEERQRAAALAGWAAANGLGQALGPPLGGVLAAAFNWHAIFAPTPPLALLAAFAAWRFVPRDPAQRATPPLAWRGALSLTAGAALLLAALSAVPQRVAPPVVLALAVAGVLLFVAFVFAERHKPTPFVSPQVLYEPSYLRSSLGVVAQMFCLGATLLAIPLALTQRGITTAQAGLIVFPLPLAIALCAPLANRAIGTVGPRPTIRLGLVVIAVTGAALTFLHNGAHNGAGTTLIVLLAVFGGGIALVQTAAAAGATRSEAGRYGAGVGLFNLIRFAGSTAGAAVVAIILNVRAEGYAIVFTVCVAAAVLGLAGTFTGADVPRSVVPIATT